MSNKQYALSIDAGVQILNFLNICTDRLTNAQINIKPDDFVTVDCTYHGEFDREDECLKLYEKNYRVRVEELEISREEGIPVFDGGEVQKIPGGRGS